MFFAPLFAQDILEIWPMDSILDPRWLDIETVWVADTSVISLLSLEAVDLSVGEIRFNSFGGDSGIIRIQSFFAYPTGGSNLAGFVIGQGLIMDSFLEWAETFSAAFGCFSLAINAPGYGESGGAPGYHYPSLIRAYPNPRNNHFYQFAYAVMRGLTYMEMLPQVDHGFMGGIGFSSGANAILMANGVDDRISFCLPIIPQTDFECSYADSGWMVNIVEESGYTTEDSHFTYMQRYISPINYIPYYRGFVMMITASQDEFEPLNCQKNSYDLIDPDLCRLETVANFDHHCYYSSYSIAGGYDSYDNSLAFYTRIIGTGNTVMNMVRNDLQIPPIPTVTHHVTGDSIEFVADVPAAFWLTNDVKFWYSIDSAWTFSYFPMTFHSGVPSLYKLKLPNDSCFVPDNLIYFVEARTGLFWLSSTPYVPEEMKFRIRPFPYEFFDMDIKEVSSGPEDFELKVYPNPFNKAVNIEVPSGARVNIFDIQGKLISGQNLHLNPPSIKWIPSNDLNSGIYLIIIKSGSHSSSGKLLYLK
ncbi:T9SS type A sorting domain-containing protein [bacterium]|nr:T9SS type A sorting domain-containing protein [bacterium]